MGAVAVISFGGFFPSAAVLCLSDEYYWKRLQSKGSIRTFQLGRLSQL